jgi:hypothetical protein
MFTENGATTGRPVDGLPAKRIISLSVGLVVSVGMGMHERAMPVLM